MNRQPSLVAFLLYSFAATACNPGADPEEVDGSAGGALLIENALAPNALAPNALAPNALAPNALAPNALAPNALAPNALAPDAMTSLRTATPQGDLSRQLVRYTVGCALAPDQSFAFSWTDADGVLHGEEYAGELGIAPGWADAPLTDITEQRLVSACLAARVNWYGVSVIISVRSKEDPLRTLVKSAELAAYPDIEGAFWGNLFAPIPYLNTCYHPGTEAVARAALRDCAVGHLEGGEAEQCGIITLQGSCAKWCDDMNGGGQFYNSCTVHPEQPGSPTTKSVITTALP